MKPNDRRGMETSGHTAATQTYAEAHRERVVREGTTFSFLHFLLEVIPLRMTYPVIRICGDTFKWPTGHV